MMNKVSLEALLARVGHIENALIGSTNLIDRVEIVGFLNSDSPVSPICVNQISHHDVICGGYLRQVMEVVDVSGTKKTYCVSPIYSSIVMCAVDTEFNVEDLYIPSLLTNKVYLEIKRRIGKGIVVTNSNIKSLNCNGNSFLLKEGKAMLQVNKDSVLLKDKHGFIRSVGQELSCLCRYVHVDTGNICYALLSLDEVFYDLRDEADGI